MNEADAIRRFPNVIKALLAAAEDTDAHWAAGVVVSAKETHSEMSVGLIREAFRKRVDLRRFKPASRVMENLSGDMLLHNSTSLPQAG